MYNMIQENRQNGKKGFTLAELLVVVAIIAVLVAISIPIFTSQLDKAKKSTDAANLRAAKGAAVTLYLSDEKTDAEWYVYDADTGKATAYTSEEAATTAAKSVASYSKVKAGQVVMVTITAKGDTSTAGWVTGGAEK